MCMYMFCALFVTVVAAQEDPSSEKTRTLAVLAEIDVRVEQMAQNHLERRTVTVFGGAGCFWHVRTELARIYGSAVAGYAGGGGSETHIKYENYAQNGHSEVVQVEVPSIKDFVETFVREFFTDKGSRHDQDLNIGDQYRGALGLPGGLEALNRALGDSEGHHVKFVQGFGNDEDVRGNVYVYDTLCQPQVSCPSFVVFHRAEAYHQTHALERLTQQQEAIAWEKATEPAFTGHTIDGKKYDFDGVGTYLGAVSGQPLFRSTAKFDSGTGWPSFTEAIADSVEERQDGDRIEVLDKHAKPKPAHLGHVFDDGPAPSGKRYCINAGALEFSTKVV